MQPLSPKPDGADNKRDVAGFVLFIVFALLLTVIPMIVALRPQWITGLFPK